MQNIDTFNVIIDTQCDGCTNRIGLLSEVGMWGCDSFGSLLLVYCKHCDYYNDYTTCRNCHEVTDVNDLTSVYQRSLDYVVCYDCAYHITSGDALYCTCH